MYYDKFLPFYMTYADSSLYSRERIQEQEFALMKSYYPETARKIQEKVEEECQLMDYEEADFMMSIGQIYDASALQADTFSGRRRNGSAGDS